MMKYLNNNFMMTYSS